MSAFVSAARSGWARLLAALGASALMAGAPLAGATDDPPAATVALAAPVPVLPKMVLRSALEQKVELHGAINFDKAGAQTPGAMAYPGGAGMLGLLVGVATHGVLASSAQSAEKNRLREAADAILVPHQATLDAFKQQQLMEAAVPRLAPGMETRLADTRAKPLADDLVLDSTPLFFITQDLRALILEHAMIVTRGAKGKPVQTTVRVVSPQRTEAANGALYWFDQQGARLKQETARMLAQSIDIALADLASAPAAPGAFKTVRYLEGDSKRMERAQILGELCGQVLIRTLRGNLMSVPLVPVDGAPPDPACGEAQQPVSQL